MLVIVGTDMSSLQQWTQNLNLDKAVCSCPQEVAVPSGEGGSTAPALGRVREENHRSGPQGMASCNTASLRRSLLKGGLWCLGLYLPCRRWCHGGGGATALEVGIPGSPRALLFTALPWHPSASSQCFPTQIVTRFHNRP